METAQQLNRIPDRSAVDDHCRRGHNNSYKSVQRHGRGQSQRLTNDLLTLVPRKAREVWNVQGNRRPKSHSAVQGGNQKLQEFGKAREARRRREHWPETAGGVIGPSEKEQSHPEQDGRADALQDSDVLDSFQNYGEIDQPENEETHGSPVRKVFPSRNQRCKQSADRLATDPCLYTKPSAGNQRSQNRRDVCA